LKIFITGGAGFIGKLLSKLLLKKGHQITIFGRFSNSSQKEIKKLEKLGIKLVKGNINNTTIVLFLGIAFLLLLIGSGTLVYAESQVVPPNFKVAFIGDQGLGPNATSVLQLIQSEDSDMVLHQGDFDYTDNPDAWDQQINDILGNDFPYFASIGNHDLLVWDGYQQKLNERLAKISGATCSGNLGVQSSCTYQGLFFILSGAGTNGSGHDIFIKDQLSKDDSIWRICSWHKNMNKMQLGEKPNDSGWEVYEECRRGGAIIATGNEHSYSRTKTLINVENQIIDPEWTEPTKLRVQKGSTFVFVSGLGGHSIRNQDRCLPITFPYGCNGEWASIYTSDQGANYGALFCSFHVDGQPNKARCYFKDIDGTIPDEFTVISFVDNTSSLVVEGKPIPMDTTISPVTDIQVNAIWMIPAILVLAGVGIIIYKLKRI